MQLGTKNELASASAERSLQWTGECSYRVLRLFN